MISLPATFPTSEIDELDRIIDGGTIDSELPLAGACLWQIRGFMLCANLSDRESSCDEVKALSRLEDTLDYPKGIPVTRNSVIQAEVDALLMMMY